MRGIELKSRFSWAVLLTGCMSLTAMTLAAQQSGTVQGGAPASGAVPNLVKYSGVLKDASGTILTTLSGVTFLIYKDEQGGTALWMETQNVQPDKAGHYTVQLGAVSKDGLPADIFMTGEARWLAVQIGNETEQPRVTLVAVPYAMKAADAQTLGGLPVSAFVLAAPSVGNAAASSAPSDSNTSTTAPAPSSSAVTTTGGTVNALPMFTTATNIQNSILTQTGGAINVGGKLTLPATGKATSTTAFNSQPQNFVASAFNGAAALPQTFQWQAEPVNNGQKTASGTLNLLFASGANKPAETGLHIASNGQITFATGQTFPGTGTGTITGVTAGTGLTGGGASGTVTLNVDTTKVAQLSGGNSFSGNQSVTGNVVATGSVSGATASFSGSNSSQILNVAQNGTGLGIFSSNVAPSASAIYGTSSNASGVGVQGFNTASTGGTAMSAATNSIGGIALFAANGASTGNSLGIFAQTNSPNGTALFATNTAGGTAAKFGGPVNVAGNTSVTGNVSSTGQLISTVATGTAPLSVSSTTQVANLNASLLGGQSASAFATTGANNFSGNQIVTGNIFTTGSVGIGIIPAFPLHVIGTMRSETGLSLGGNATLSVDAPGVAGGQFLVSGGNVGIGTNAPAFPLHVNGTMRAETGLSLGGNAVLSVDAPGASGGRLQVNNSGVSIGLDTPMNSNPHMSFSGMFFGSLCNSINCAGIGGATPGSPWGAFVPDRNVVITRITATIDAAIDPSCLPGSAGVWQGSGPGGGGIPLATAPLPANSNFLDSQVIPPVPVTAGTQLFVSAQLDNSSNCKVGGSAGGNLWINVQYVMQ